MPIIVVADSVLEWWGPGRSIPLPCLQRQRPVQLYCNGRRCQGHAHSILCAGHGRGDCFASPDNLCL